MKKIISLLASVAMLASMFTSVSAAELANNAPVIDTTVTELSAEEYENDWMGEALPEGQKAYLVDLTLSGLDLSVKASGTAAATKKKRDGVLLMYTGYTLTLDKPENVAAVVAMDGLATGDLVGSAIKFEYNSLSATAAYPQTTDGNTTAVTATDALIAQFVMTTTGDVKGTASSEAKVTAFTKDVPTDTLNYGASEAQQVAYTVNGEEGNSVVIGSVVPDPEPKEMEVTVADKRFDLDINDDTVADGYAWEVLVTNYDSTKTLSAKFTDAETGLPRAGKEKTEITGLAAAAETDGSIEFVALLQLSQARNVNFEIVVE